MAGNRPKRATHKARAKIARVPNSPAVSVTPNRSTPVERASGKQIQILTLVLLYVIAVGLHVAALWEGARFPHLSTDEAQYTMVGENLRLGKGYTIRGQIHSGIPPVYPVWVAIAHTLGGPSRHSVLWFNSAAICLVVFPAFALARQFRLSWLNSYLMAMAAVFLPHTSFAAMYMAESLQYPLVLTAFYVAAKWLDQPFLKRDVLLGILLGAGLLNKFAELSFLIALLAAILILSFRARREDQSRRLGHSMIVFGIVLALEMAWIGWKNIQGASALGLYGDALAESVHASAPLKLLLAYLADFFLAPGLIVAVPLFYWFRENWRERGSLAVLLATTLACQLGIHGFVEARLTGAVRERLLLYSFPLMGIAAVASMERLQQQRHGWLRYLAPYGALVFVALLALYQFPAPPSPAVDVPWAALLGALTLDGFRDFTTRRFGIVAVAAVVMAASLLTAAPRRKAATALAVIVVLFHVSAFLFAARILGDWSRIGVGAVEPLIKWLASSGVKAGDRLGIAGGPWSFEDRSTFVPADEFFERWIIVKGPYKLFSVQLEALGRHDLRMLTGAADIPTHLRPGDFFLADTRVSNMEFVSESYPYYLYREPSQSIGTPRALYTVDIPPSAFRAPLGTLRGDGTIVGTGVGQMGVLAITAGMPFIPGRYQMTPHMRTKPGELLTLAVNRDPTNQPVIHFDVPGTGLFDPGALEFTADSQEPLNFGIYGKSTPDFVFEGLTVQFVSPNPPIPVQRMPLPTDQFVEEKSAWSAKPSTRMGLYCAVDNVNNAGFGPADRVPKAEGLHLFGWAFDHQAKSAQGPLLVELVSDTNRAYYATAVRNARPDVLAAFHVPDAGQIGFWLHAKVQNLAAGWYRLYLIQMENGQAVECQTYRNVIVEN